MIQAGWKKRGSRAVHTEACRRQVMFKVGGERGKVQGMGKTVRKGIACLRP